ncbi:methylated-DNA--[protein]-cysteine S-methyltransferase [Streptomyces albidoflavus]
MTAYWTTHPGPLGDLLLTCDAIGALTSLTVPGAPGAKGLPAPGTVRDDAPFAEARRELDAYFVGERDRFTLRLAPPPASDFRRRVWAALDEIPYGTTVSYGQLAAAIGVGGPPRRPGGGAALRGTDGARRTQESGPVRGGGYGPARGGVSTITLRK